ncbi:Uncharacterized protein DBV15_10285 [Temnothorax longispinosus]|uniref:Uncharacterized protein n=1 Tax=Temnothorax longispinosus TaxID=300112 RepID=A0A4S2KXT4_9HYME|nr:Uncharacterized protein DBV15_10285 [Temnothorax longispinosus]
MLIESLYVVADFKLRDYSLRTLDGNTLDNFAELKNIEGLKDGSIIKVVEEPVSYTHLDVYKRQHYYPYRFSSTCCME